MLASEFVINNQPKHVQFTLNECLHIYYKNYKPGAYEKTDTSGGHKEGMSLLTNWSTYYPTKIHKLIGSQ